MALTRWARCKVCKEQFFYGGPHDGRTREYCDKHDVEGKRALARERKRRQRAKQKIEQSQPANVALLGGRGRGSERERGGLSSPSSKSRKSSPLAPVGGMFADLPGEIANQKRRALGLPALAF